MKKIIMLAAVLLLAVFIGLKIQADPGYVLIAYGKWSIEMPIWFAILSLVCFFLLIYGALRFLDWLRTLSPRYRLWRQHRLSHRSHSQTSRGLIELSEGHWQKAEQFLIKSAHNSETPLINYLSAARAAQQQSAYERRDNYLRLAHQVTPEASVAIGLTQAELQLKHGQLEQALATLKHLQSVVPHHNLVLSMLLELYERLNDWENLLDLLPRCIKNQIAAPEHLFNLEKKAYLALLKQADEQDNAERLKTIWLNVPSRIEKNPEMIVAYAQGLLRHHQDKIAEELIRNTLKKSWNESLIHLYGDCQLDTKPHQQYEQAILWLKQHKTSPMLYLTLGKFAEKLGLWGQAKDYLQTSMQLNPSPTACIHLAKLIEKHEGQNAALEHYKDGLSLYTLKANEYQLANRAIPAHYASSGKNNLPQL